MFNVKKSINMQLVSQNYLSKQKKKSIKIILIIYGDEAMHTTMNITSIMQIYRFMRIKVGSMMTWWTKSCVLARKAPYNNFAKRSSFMYFKQTK